MIQGVETDEISKPSESIIIQPASSYKEDVTDYFINGGRDAGTPMPFRSMDWFKLRSHEVTMWAGINGHGKSLILGQICLWLADRGESTVIASFEMTPTQTLARMTCQAVGVADPSLEYIQKFNDWSEDYLFVLNHQKTIEWQRVCAIVHHAATELGAQHFIIDSLMKCGIGPDDMAAEREFVDSICAISNETGIHVHLVDHIRKQMDETRRVSKFDVRGNGQKVDMIDNLMIMSRNKRKEREAERDPDDQDERILKGPDAWLSCEKQRHGTGKEGFVSLWFDEAAQLFRSMPNRPPRPFINLESEDVSEQRTSESAESDDSSDSGDSGGHEDAPDPFRTESSDGDSVSGDTGLGGDEDT